MKQFFMPFNLMDDLKRYGDSLLSTDAEKSLRNFIVLIVICVLFDSLYLSWISYTAIGVQLSDKLPIIQTMIAICTFIAFMYMFVSVDKAIVTSDLFSEEKIRRIKYQEINFTQNKLLNKFLNLIAHIGYIFTLPIKTVLSTNPAAALLLTTRVIFMVLIHIGVLLFVFLFTSNQVGDAVAQKNRELYGQMLVKMDDMEKNKIENNEAHKRLTDELNKLTTYRQGEVEGKYRKDSSGAGKYYGIYNQQIESLNNQLKSQEEEIRKNFPKRPDINTINFHQPSEIKELIEMQAKTGIALKNDDVASRASYLFEYFSKNPMDFIGKMVPAFGMSLLLIAPLFILIVMKIFQNRSLRHYYDIELQEHFDYYKRGVYDWILSDSVKPLNGNPKISAIIFSDIYYEVIRKFSKNLSQSNATLLQKEIYKYSMDLAKKTNELKDVSADKSRKELEILNLNSAIEATNRFVEQIPIEDTSSTAAFEHAIIKITTLKEAIQTAERESLSLESKVRDLNQQLQEMNVNMQKNELELAKWVKKYADNNEEIKVMLAESIARLIPFLSKNIYSAIDLEEEQKSDPFPKSS